MEKIQAAIAKARTQRETVAAQAGSVPPMPEPGARLAQNGSQNIQVGPVDAVQAAWQALPEVPLRPDKLRKSRVLTLENGEDALPFDVLRTRMLQQMRANGWRRIGITSATGATGKSVLALNLAFSLARQQNQRTILLECDFRRPSLARYLGINSRHQMAAVLEGEAAFEDNALRHGRALAIATQHGARKAPAELLQAPACRAALDQIEAAYAPTVMLFDLPPLSAGDDVMSLTDALDAVLIVAAGEQTTIQEIDHSERELAAQVAVMGVVVTKCRYVGETGAYGYS